MTSMVLDTVNTKSYSFILCFMLFKERLLKKHCCIVVFVNLKMFLLVDSKEQDVSIIGLKTVFVAIMSHAQGIFCQSDRSACLFQLYNFSRKV